MPINSGVIGQGESDWGNLLYLLLVVVLPLLGSFGQWIREKAGKKDESSAGELIPNDKDTKPKRPGKRPPLPAKPFEVAKKPVAATPVKPSAVRQQPPAPPITKVPPKKPVATPPQPKAIPKAKPVVIKQEQPPPRDMRRAMVDAIVASDEEYDAIIMEDEPKSRPTKSLQLGRVNLGDLQRAIVMNELLQPPLALREKDHLAGLAD